MQNQIPLNKTAVFIYTNLKPITSYVEVMIRKMQILSNASNAAMFVFTEGSDLQIRAIQAVINAKFSRAIKVLRADSLRLATKYLADHFFENAYYVTIDTEFYRLTQGRVKDYVKPTGFLKTFVPVTISSDTLPKSDPASHERIKNMAATGNYQGFRNLLPSWTRYGRGTVPTGKLFNQLRSNMALDPINVTEDAPRKMVTCTEGKQLDATFCYICRSDAEAISLMLGLKGKVHQVEKEGGTWWSPGRSEFELKSRIFTSIAESEMGDRKIVQGSWDTGGRGKDIGYKTGNTSITFLKDPIPKAYTLHLGLTEKACNLPKLEIQVYLAIILEFLRQFEYSKLTIKGEPEDIEYLATKLAGVGKWCITADHQLVGIELTPMTT